MFNKPIKYILSLIGIITVINLIFIFLFSLIWNNPHTVLGWQYFYYFLTSLLSAIFVSFFIVSTAPVLKDFLTTYRQLLRLENLSHPLLMKLSLEAPGTYHHSLSVANIASRAAKAIKADSLLTRVGAYYHDIGKTTNCEYFIENQQNGENPHSVIEDPKESFLIIKNHVNDGIKLAEEYHLPKEIIAFIAEHHGTQLSNFYDLAINKGKKARKSEYSYSGPKPLSKETAIIMLADIIEAKIRLLDKITPEKIKQVISETINEKIADGQLELSGLKDKDLEMIKKSFIDTLEVIYHQRIKYNNSKTSILSQSTK